MKPDRPVMPGSREARAPDTLRDTRKPVLAPFRSRSHAHIYARQHARIKCVLRSQLPTPWVGMSACTLGPGWGHAPDVQSTQENLNAQRSASKQS
jgi:hypothetical protein